MKKTIFSIFIILIFYGAAFIFFMSDMPSALGAISSLISLFIIVATWKGLSWFKFGKINSFICIFPWIILLVFNLTKVFGPEYRHLIANNGDADAQYELGWRNEKGYEIPKNNKEALMWYQLAADQGQPMAQYRLGKYYQIVVKDLNKSFNFLKSSAEAGIFEAKLELGYMYRWGHGVKVDHKKAFEWFKNTLIEEEYSKSEDKEVLFKSYWNQHDLFNANDYSLLQRSENALGKYYEDGQVVKKDYEEAVKWYKRAARKIFFRDNIFNYSYSVNPEAQFNLGIMYSSGLGVEQDYVKGLMWLLFSKYSTQTSEGLESTRDAIEKLKQIMSSEQIETANELFNKWFSRDYGYQVGNKLINYPTIGLAKDSQEALSEGQEVKKEYWDNGKLKRESHWKDEKKDGLVTEWDESGEKKLEINYKNGKREGVTTEWYYKSGEKYSETHYKNGAKDGLDIEWWYKSGKKRSKTHYKNGAKDGLETTWYESGEKESETLYKNENLEGLLTSWFESGNKSKETPYKNGQKDGLEITWFESGDKDREAPYKNGNLEGLETTWYKTGVKRSEKQWKYDRLWLVTEWDADGTKKNGVYTTLYEGGTKKKEIHYKNGVKDGLSTGWYESGEKYSETHYKNGKQEGLGIEWYKSGKKRSKAHYKNGAKDGLEIDWYKSGGKRREVHLKEEELNGKFTYWYENGNKNREGHYKDSKRDGLITVWRETGEKLSERFYKNGKLKGLQTVWSKKGEKLENKNNTSVNSSLSEEVKAEADAAFLKQNYDVSGVLYEKAIDLGYDFTTPSAVCDSMSTSGINACVYYHDLVTEKSIENLSYPQITDHIWIVNNENISPLCMEFIWMSGDNYEEYEEQYPQAKNFTSYPGKYWGNIIPLDPLNASWGESLSIPKPLKKCNKTKPNDLISIENNVFSHSKPIDSITQSTTKYTLLAEWGSNGCSKVIPQFADQCQSLVFVNIEDTSSRISQGGFNSYAHIIVKDKAYIVPVTNGMPLEDLLKLIESN